MHHFEASTAFAAIFFFSLLGVKGGVWGWGSRTVFVSIPVISISHLKCPRTQWGFKGI